MWELNSCSLWAVKKPWYSQKPAHDRATRRYECGNPHTVLALARIPIRCSCACQLQLCRVNTD